jgi:hypothetical protein
LGCARSSAPKGWLPIASQARQEAFGGWIEVKYGPGEEEKEVKGELIAVEEDSLFALSEIGFVSIAAGDISRATLRAYDSKHGALATWTLLGTLSTASHGIILIASAPIWILWGSLTTAAASHAPEVKYKEASWDELSKYARFPQGMPEELDRSHLKAKGFW